MIKLLFSYFDGKTLTLIVFLWIALFGILVFGAAYSFLDNSNLDDMHVRFSDKRHMSSSNLTFNPKEMSLKLVCYYNLPNNESFLLPEEIPPGLCTHINVAFAGITPTNYSLYVPKNNSQIITNLVFLKLKNKNLKILISVGGANNNDFSRMVKYHENRKMFINSTMRFIKKFKLDGVDIDWEWPGSNGESKEKIKFVQLLQEIKDEFKRHKKNYILSIAAGAIPSLIKMSYYVHYISQYVDFINLMAYDYHFFTSYYPITDYNSPLYASAKDNNSILSNVNVNFSVNYWISQSMPKKKVILGIPTFGHTYRLMSSLNHGLHAPANGFGSVGANGFIKYPEVCNFLNLLGTFKEYDDESKVPYAYKQYDWISYDDENSIGIKAQYIIDEKLGGAMIYSLNAEDYLGVCREDKLKYPLIRKIQSIFSSCSVDGKSSNTCNR